MKASVLPWPYLSHLRQSAASATAGCGAQNVGSKWQSDVARRRSPAHSGGMRAVYPCWAAVHSRGDTLIAGHSVEHSDMDVGAYIPHPQLRVLRTSISGISSELPLCVQPLEHLWLLA